MNAALLIDVAAEQSTVRLGDAHVTLPFGPARLRRTELTSDPPQPEELTNAIGAVVDHVDDLLRELPESVDASDVRVSGPEMHAIAAVEAGHAVSLPFALTRDAVEDVFRTVATERAADRARNPGLGAEHVDSIVGGCCVLVAVMRRLHLDAVTVVSP